MSNGYMVFPHIDPVIVSLGPISIRWYGVMYLIWIRVCNVACE